MSRPKSNPVFFFKNACFCEQQACLHTFAKEHEPIVNVGQGRAPNAIQVSKKHAFVNDKHAYILLRRSTSQSSTSGKVVPERQETYTKHMFCANRKHAYILLRRNTSQSSTSGMVVPEGQYNSPETHVLCEQQACLQAFAKEHEPIVNVGQGRAQKATQVYKNICFLRTTSMLTEFCGGPRAHRQHRAWSCLKGNASIQRHMFL
jgi:hypothetical protein